MNQAIIKKDKLLDSTNSISMNLCDSLDIISIDECRKILGVNSLSDGDVKVIRDNLIGIVDSILNSYLEKYEYGK